MLEQLVRARGIAWVPLPRENPSTLIFSPRPVDPMWYVAYASNMNRRLIEARVQRTQSTGQYLQIILDGAREHELPADYQSQLAGTRSAG